MITIKIYPDGNQICALIGDMPTEDARGFGDTITQALIALAYDMMCEQEDGKDWGLPL